MIKAANMTDMRYKIAILSGDVSAILGPSGQDFCTDLSVYAIYPDPAPQQADTSTGACVHDVEQFRSKDYADTRHVIFIAAPPYGPDMCWLPSSVRPSSVPSLHLEN